MDNATLNFFEQLYLVFIAKKRYLVYLEGVGNTILIALLACVIGIIIGLLVTLVKIAPKNSKLMKFLGWLCNLYTTIIRGTPVVVQLLLMYYIILSSIKTLWGGVFIAFLTFGLNSGAYVSEILRGGLLSVDRGQMEASRSLGLNWKQSMRLVVIPQGIKTSIPSLFNEFIQLVKETSVLGALPILELTKASNMIMGQTANPLPYLIIAIIYLIIVIGLQQVQKTLERRFSKGDIR